MNINEKMIALGKEIMVPVAQDIYEEDAEQFITFVYEDEKAALRGDNKTIAETAFISISLCTPQEFNYFEKKEAVKNYLEKHGFLIKSIQSWLTNEKKGTHRIRQTVFSVTYTEERKR